MSGFEVIADRRGRITGFTHPDIERPVVPEHIVGFLDSAQSLVYNEQEYILTPEGNVIHTGIDMDLRVCSLGSGVLIGSGVRFSTDEERSITIGNNTRLEEVVVKENVTIGNSCVLLGREIGSGVTIHDYVQVRQATVIGRGVTIESSAKLDTDVWVGADAVIGYASELGHGVRVEPGIRVGNHHKAGHSTGRGNVQRHKSAPIISKNIPDARSRGRIGSTI